MTNLKIKDEIKNFLTGKNNGTSCKNIIDYVGERFGGKTTDVEIRQYIQQLRMEGKLIIAGNKGYGLTTDSEAIKKYLKSRWCEVCKEMKSFRVMAQYAGVVGMLPLWEKEEQC